METLAICTSSNHLGAWDTNQAEFVVNQRPGILGFLTPRHRRAQPSSFLKGSSVALDGSQIFLFITMPKYLIDCDCIKPESGPDFGSAPTKRTGPTSFVFLDPL